MRGNAGFSVVIELIAAALLLLSVLALVSITKVGFSEFQNYRIQTAIIDQESLVVSALQSEVSLNDLRAALHDAKSVAAGTPLKLNNQPVAFQGTSWFTFDHVQCAAGSSPDCDLKVILDIQCTTGDCVAAYRIASQSGSFAIGADSDTLQLSDYTVPIPFEVATRTTDMAASTCDPSMYMFSSGFDKVTGKIFCVNRPTAMCTDMQVALSIKYDKLSNSVVPVCQPIKPANCDPGYSLQSVDPRSLMPDSPGVSGWCVYTGKNPAPWPVDPADAPSISGTFCPPHYVIDQNPANFSCVLTNESSTAGNCWGQTVPAIRGDTSWTITGRDATCVVNYPAQTCGATWTATAHLHGQCILDPSFPEGMAAK